MSVPNLLLVVESRRYEQIFQTHFRKIVPNVVYFLNYVSLLEQVFERNSMFSSYRLESPRKLIRALVAVVAVLVATIAPFSATASAEKVDVQFEYITVNSGDSMWDLARHHAPGEDPRDWIADVVNLNGLESSNLIAGQQIALP